MHDPRTTSHEWFERRLALFVAAVLDDDESARVEAHLTACAPCRDAALALREREKEPAGTGGHLPADLLASWPRRAAVLRGLERRLVREHLERCAACRADLALLGHSQELVAATREEREAANALREAGTRRAVNGAVRDVRPARWFGARSARTWIAGAMAVAAALVVATIVNRPHGPDAIRPPGPRGGSGITAGSPPGPAAQETARASAVRDEAAADPRMAATMSRHVTRGAVAGAPGSPSLRVEANAGGAELLALAESVRGMTQAAPPVAAVTLQAGATLHFAVPASLLQAELPDSLGVRLVSPDGRVLYASRIASRSLYPRRRIAIATGTRALAEGTYRVSFLLGEADAASRDYTFTLRR